MILRHALLRPPRHLKHDQPRRGPLVELERPQVPLIHARRGPVVGHEREAAEVGPLHDHLLDGPDHPRGEPATLVVAQHEDVGQVGEGHVVGDEAGEADQLEVGALFS